MGILRFTWVYIGIPCKPMHTHVNLSIPQYTPVTPCIPLGIRGYTRVYIGMRGFGWIY